MWKKWQKPTTNKAHVALSFAEHGLMLAVLHGVPATPNSKTACEIHQLACESMEWADVLAAWVNKQQLRGARVHLALPFSDYQLHQLALPKLSPIELRAAAGWKLREFLPFALDQAVIEVFESPGRVIEGEHRYFAAVAHRDVIQLRLDGLLASGLQPDVIDVAELACRHSLVQQLQQIENGHENGVLAVMLNAHEGLLVMIKQGLFHISRRLDWGHADAMQAGSVDNAWLDRLVLEVQRSLDFFEVNFKQAPPKISLLAPALEDERLTQMLRNLNMQLLPFNTATLPFSRLVLPDKINLDTCVLMGMATRAAALEKEVAA
ncbi:MAG: pilus assembly protein PilM [Gammaproteobacteria bacterium]|nr:pilus assembly protein PilM [Gammaproteobacteria bacterium]